MKKILFITSRNIISTCGELRLIKNRANVLKEAYGYTTDFIAYRITVKHNLPGSQKSADCPYQA